MFWSFINSKQFEVSVCCGLSTITTTPIYVEVLEFPHLKVHTFPCLFISINHKLQENGNLEILFNLIGFELTPSLEQTAGFFLPDISLMWLSPDEANSEWKTRSWLKCFCFHGWQIIQIGAKSISVRNLQGGFGPYAWIWAAQWKLEDEV